MGKFLWRGLSILTFVFLIAFAPMAFIQADGRLVLQVLVVACMAFIFIIMWEIIKEAFKQ